MSFNENTNDKIKSARPGERRHFLKLMSAGIVVATGWAAGVGRIAQAAVDKFEPLWPSAEVLIGNSPEEQSPSPFIECPLFFVNGQFANASHTLDLSNLQATGQVIGTITVLGTTIVPDFSASIAAAATQGSDGFRYLVVAGEGNVIGTKGYLKRVSKVIIRCKYKITEDNDGNILLISCINCVIILVRD